MIDLPLIKVVAVCHDCRRRHTYRVLPADLAAAMGEWTTKHAGHPIAFSRPHPLYANRLVKWLRDFWSACPLWAPAWYEYGHNADVKAAYVASAAYTITLGALASSSGRVAGREGTAVSNTTNKYLDYLVGAKIKTGTTPTASKQIDLAIYAAYKDTPTYPDVFDGTDSNETVTSNNVLNGALRIAASVLVDSTSDRDYFFAPFSVTALFGGLVPPTHHGPFAAHDTAANLHATDGNHEIFYTPIYGTVT